MMNREQIVNKLKECFDSIYCDTCEYSTNTPEDYKPCLECHRKSMNWAVSSDYVNMIVDDILSGGNK